MTTGEALPRYIGRLERDVEDAVRQFDDLPESVVAWRPHATAWCIKEIIGHLIDSAANNHQRFVRAASQDDLVFPGYAQDEWVRAHGYASAPWRETLSFWHAYNRHLARVMANVRADVRTRRCARHNLHEIAWRPFPAEEPATLDDLMYDYVLHLEHHLRQVGDRVREAHAVERSGRPQ